MTLHCKHISLPDSLAFLDINSFVGFNVEMSAGSLLLAGRLDEYDKLVASNLEELLINNDVVVLAQASMARAISSIDERLKNKVLTSPESGVRAMSNILGE
jgi:hypothetical protein